MVNIFDNPKEFSKKISDLKSSQKELKEKVKYYPKKEIYRKSNIEKLKSEISSQKGKQEDYEKKLREIKSKRARVKKTIEKAVSGKMSYRKGNPLKGLLESKGKIPKIKVTKGENINLFKASW